MRLQRSYYKHPNQAITATAPSEARACSSTHRGSGSAGPKVGSPWGEAAQRRRGEPYTDSRLTYTRVWLSSW